MRRQSHDLFRKLISVRSADCQSVWSQLGCQLKISDRPAFHAYVRVAGACCRLLLLVCLVMIPCSGTAQSRGELPQQKKPEQKPTPTPVPAPAGQPANPAPTPAKETEKGQPIPAEEKKGEEKKPEPTEGQQPLSGKEPDQQPGSETQTPAQTEATPSPRPLPAREAAPSSSATQPVTEPSPQEATPAPSATPATEATPVAVQATPAPTPTPTPFVETLTTQLRERFRQETDALSGVFSLSRIIIALLILLSAYFLNRVVVYLLKRIARRQTRYAQLLRRFAPLFGFSLWIVAGLLVASLFASSLLAGLIIVLAVLLAAAVAGQSLLRDLAGGVVILLERPFQLGDRVTIGQHQGEVRDIGLRAFRLQSPDGSSVSIPNAEILRQPVANANPGTMESLVTTELFLPAGINSDEARRIAREAAVLSPCVYLDKPVEVEIDEAYRTERLIRILVRAHVFDAAWEHRLRSDIVRNTEQGFRRLLTEAQERQNPAAT